MQKYEIVQKGIKSSRQRKVRCGNMNKEIIIAVNEESAEIFKDFAEQYPEYITYVEHKALIGVTEVAEFIIEIAPEVIAALSAYFIARIQCSKKEIRIKKGDLEIELKNIDITPEKVMELLSRLEQKVKKK